MHYGKSRVEVVVGLAGVAAAVLFAKHDEIRYRWPELVGGAISSWTRISRLKRCARLDRVLETALITQR